MISQPTLWSRSPRNPVIQRDEIHVYQTGLGSLSISADQLYGVLAEDERQRASAFYHVEDQRRYIVCRGALRTILGSYLHIDPQFLRFQYNSFGKPALAKEFCQSGLQFNVSHSGSIALFAFALNRNIGIDVELVKRRLPIQAVAENFFSTKEISDLRSLPESLKPIAFANCWTRKEAFVKAKGIGLFSLPLDQFNVTLIPGALCVEIQPLDPESEPFPWSLREIDLGKEYAAALVVEGTRVVPQCWKWRATP